MQFSNRSPPVRPSFPVVPFAGDDDGNVDNPLDEDPPPSPIMNTKTATKAAAAGTKKAAAAKMTYETEADYRSTASACRPVSKLYGFGTNDKYAVSFDTEGTTDFCLVSFFVSGVLPETGGYVATLSDDGYTIRWSRPVDGFLFSMEHLKSVMGADYSDTHVRVRSFDEVTQAISKDRLEADANGLFWGKPQEIHLEKRCTGSVEAVAMPYRAPRSLEPITDSKGRRHYQYYSIVHVKAQLAEQRKTAKKKAAKTRPLELYEAPSSQGTTPSPGVRRRRQSDWGGSHRDPRPAVRPRGSRVSEENEDAKSEESYEY